MEKKSKDSFPKADTCFFILELPEYSSKEVMKSKILQAVNLDNVSINNDKPRATEVVVNTNSRRVMFNEEMDDDYY